MRVLAHGVRNIVLKVDFPRICYPQSDFVVVDFYQLPRRRNECDVDVVLPDAPCAYPAEVVGQCLRVLVDVDAHQRVLLAPGRVVDTIVFFGVEALNTALVPSCSVYGSQPEKVVVFLDLQIQVHRQVPLVY